MVYSMGKWKDGCKLTRSVAIVVDAGGPSRDDVEAVESVSGDVGLVQVHGVLLVAERNTGVVADAVGEAGVLPGAQGVAVVETSDGRGDQSVGREAAGGEADVLE